MKRFSNLLILAMVVIGCYIANYEPPTTTTYVEHVVRKGETVWSIAGIYADKQILYFNEFVWTIRKANPQDSKFIYPGQVLQIPMKVYAKK